MNNTEDTMLWQNLTGSARVTWRNFSFEATSVWHVAQGYKAKAAARVNLYGNFIYFILPIWCLTSC